MLPTSLQSSLDALKGRHENVEITVSLGPNGVVLAMVRVTPSVQQLEQQRATADAAFADLLQWAGDNGQAIELTRGVELTRSDENALEL